MPISTSGRGDGHQICRRLARHRTGGLTSDALKAQGQEKDDEDRLWFPQGGEGLWVDPCRPGFSVCRLDKKRRAAQAPLCRSRVGSRLVAHTSHPGPPATHPRRRSSAGDGLLWSSSSCGTCAVDLTPARGEDGGAGEDRRGVPGDHPTALQKTARPPWHKHAWWMLPAQEAPCGCHREAV
jgi:hypothetical protein